MSKAIVIEAPNCPPKMTYFESVFLAGGITNVCDWQADVIKMLAEQEITIFNPRRANFDVSNPDVSYEQITWEHRYLRLVHTVFIWFSHETLQPISLFELGSALQRDQKLIIGCDPKYPRSMDVRVQCALQGYKGSIFSDVETMADFYKKTLTLPAPQCKI